MFGLVPMDNNSWCKCPRCQAELNQAEMSNQQFNNGKASDYICDCASANNSICPFITCRRTFTSHSSTY